MLDTLRQDLRHAARSLLRTPGIALAVVATLGLGIGANTATFSLLNTVMLRQLPVPDPDRLVELLTTYPGEPRMNFYSLRAYEHYRTQSRTLADLFGVVPGRLRVTPYASDAVTLDGWYVTGNLFDALGLSPAAGRLIEPRDAESTGTGNAVVVVSWAYWNSRFNLDPAVVGKAIVVDGVPATIVGVTPREFSGLQVGVNPDLWAPLSMWPGFRDALTGRGASLRLMGRLAPGVSIEQAQAEMTVLDRRRVEDVAQMFGDPLWLQATIAVRPAGGGFSVLRDQFGGPLLILMLVVLLLLLLACANIAGLLVARGAARQRETAVRVALGAGRARLFREVLTESIMLSALGGMLGAGLAAVGADALVGILSSGRPMIGLPERLQLAVTPDARVLFFTAAAAVLTALLFGLAPALAGFVGSPSSVLREASVVGDPRSRRLLRTGLVVTQVALSAVLVSAATFLGSHLSNLRSVDLGFRSESVLLVTLDASRSGYERLALSRAFADLLDCLQTLPGVRSAALSGTTPISGAGASRFVSVQGVTERREDRRYVSLNWVGPRYFDTLGTALLTGRDFQFEDEGRAPVAIVNQAMARRYFGDASAALGRRVMFDSGERSYEVIGVVEDAKYSSLHEAPPRTMYLNAFQDSRGLSSQLVISTAVAPTALVGAVRQAVSDVLKSVEIGKVTTLEEQVDASIVPERLVVSISNAFGGLGALLAAVGLYGLLAHRVARRTTEIGVRMALGATPAGVTSMVLKDALGTVVGGLVVGVPLAFWSQRLLVTWLQDMKARAALSLAIATLVMLGVAALAAYVPARRAARVAPMAALRAD